MQQIMGKERQKEEKGRGQSKSHRVRNRTAKQTIDSDGDGDMAKQLRKLKCQLHDQSGSTTGLIGL
eukprot:6211101-Pleurochrysis_carterae.AAC.2